jgi:hypothetical protein
MMGIELHRLLIVIDHQVAGNKIIRTPERWPRFVVGSVPERRFGKLLPTRRASHIYNSAKVPWPLNAPNAGSSAAVVGL